MLGPVAIAAVCLALTSCSSKPPSNATPEGDGAPAMSATESASGGNSGDTAAAIDACALLSAKDDVAPLIGVTVDGVPSGHGATTSCHWENPQTYESVTVDIGAPDTAIGDKLPPVEVETTPAPDGMRILGGAIEFAAGSRYNSVQVATPVSMSADASTAAAVDLVNKIKPKLTQ
jgi:hypothetical protein